VTRAASSCNAFANDVWATKNAGASKMKGVEIEGEEIVAPEGRGGKRGRNEYRKPRFPLSNIVVESSIGLVCPSGLQQPIELM